MTLPYVYSPRCDIAKSLPHLQRTILERVQAGYVNYAGYNGIEITATLRDVSNAVESAYILTAKEDLPKVTSRMEGFARIYRVDGVPNGLALPGEDTSSEARKRATAWLAIAQFLEREEKAKAYEEAKAKAEADAAAKAAEAARTRRLDELADEWFGEDSYADLGPNKAAAVKEIYRLETTLEERDCA
ncbi:hypothetical protein ACFFGR_09340 [Arthrobacter liuii]|uniref:Uncharacterized protein n=1 Tax=Arthrobacter liuii TaxID=1476996 RepID=A0ABQ2AMM4_9MICC|nr:hypothetical protein [Arthrobacter liuii]GGH93844.1 hypothetical protein GCM10007170_15660 [Arthrobacter liuii]